MGDYLLNINKVMIFQFQDIVRFEMAYHEKMEKMRNLNGKFGRVIG